MLGYTSTHMQRDGSWRNVEIKSRSANHVIRSRSGYFAPDDNDAHSCSSLLRELRDEFVD